MIEFRAIKAEEKDIYNEYLMADSGRGCENSFVNLYVWGRQKIAFIDGQAVIFSHGK